MPLNCIKPKLSPAAGLAEFLYKTTSGADVLLASVDSISKLFSTAVVVAVTVVFNVVHAVSYTHLTLPTIYSV